jgi:crotonobetainyl-CoA:carnitine CoA-transferase CaiB-like acyl-CoA transferase
MRSLASPPSRKGTKPTDINLAFYLAKALFKVKPRRAPDVGEHSAEVLRDAGYSDAEIRALRAEGVIA